MSPLTVEQTKANKMTTSAADIATPKAIQLWQKLEAKQQNHTAAKAEIVNTLTYCTFYSERVAIECD